MKKTPPHLITEVPCRQLQGKLTIRIDLVMSGGIYCTLSECGEVVDRGRFLTTPKAIENGSRICCQHAWRWRPERMRPGSASNNVFG